MALSEQVIIQTNAIFGIGIAIGIVGLTIKKIVRNSTSRYHEWRKRLFRKASVEFALSDDSASLLSLRPQWPGDRRALLELFIHAAENVKGAPSDRLYLAFDQLGLVDYSLRRLQSWRWWVRAEAAYHLGWMHSARSEAALFNALADPHWEVMLSASRALARQKGVDVLPDVLKHFTHLSRWASLEAAEIFFEMGTAVIPKLVDILLTLPAEAQRLVIEVLGHYKDTRATEPLISLLGSADHEVRARAIKALGAFGDPRAIPRLIELTEEHSWQIRLLASTALGQLKAAAAIPALTKRLTDLDARVRLRAAASLSALGIDGKRELQQAYDQGNHDLKRLLRPYLTALALLLTVVFSTRFSSAEQLTPVEIVAQMEQHVRTVVPNVEATDAWKYYQFIVEKKGAPHEERQAYLQRLLSKHHAPAWTAPKQQSPPPNKSLSWRGYLSWRPWNELPPIVNRILYFYDHTVLYYFAVLNLTYLMLFLISLLAIVRYLQMVRVPFTRSLMHSPMTLPISILVPAYNEAAGIVESVRSFLTVHFPEFEVIVINDGSTDTTLEDLRREFQLQPASVPNSYLISCQTIRGVFRSPLHTNLVVIDKINGGKSDALNAGINVSRYPLFCAVDADSVLEPEALLRVVRPFMIDPTVVAVGGVVRIANGNHIQNGSVQDIRLPRQALPLFQIVEYLRAFFSGRMGWSALQSLLIISGAFGIFRKDAVLSCGGYRTDTVGEDMDLVIRLHKQLRDEKKSYQMVFIPDPICWTEAPSQWSVLRAQRDRWQRGLVETLWTNRRMILNPKYGRIGLFALPYYVVFELFGPLVEFGGYLAVVLTLVLLPYERTFLLLFFMTAVCFGILLSVGAVILEELAFHRYPRIRQMLTLILFSFLENFGYRQINAWWRCRGLFRGIFMKNQGWGTMIRKGLGKPVEGARVDPVTAQIVSQGPVPTRSDAATPGLTNVRSKITDKPS